MKTMTPLDVEMQGCVSASRKVFIVIRIVYSFRGHKVDGAMKSTDAVNMFRACFACTPREALEKLSSCRCKQNLAPVVCNPYNGGSQQLLKSSTTNYFFVIMTRLLTELRLWGRTVPIRHSVGMI